MHRISGGQVNPLIGAAGVSAVPNHFERTLAQQFSWKYEKKTTQQTE
jgi:Na+-transporting methylmalonyl-CoA/oxaloacetate decarboxylase beta subunit